MCTSDNCSREVVSCERSLCNYMASTLAELLTELIDYTSHTEDSDIIPFLDWAMQNP